MSAVQFADDVLRPNGDTFFRLKTQLQQCDVTWMRDFVRHSGLDRLLGTLSLLGNGADWSSVSDAILQLDCIECLQTIMNCPIGVEEMSNESSRIQTLATGKEKDKLCHNC